MGNCHGPYITQKAMQSMGVVERICTIHDIDLSILDICTIHDIDLSVCLGFRSTQCSEVMILSFKNVVD